MRDLVERFLGRSERGYRRTVETLLYELFSGFERPLVETLISKIDFNANLREARAANLAPQDCAIRLALVLIKRLAELLSDRARQEAVSAIDSKDRTSNFYVGIEKMLAAASRIALAGDLVNNLADSIRQSLAKNMVSAGNEAGVDEKAHDSVDRIADDRDIKPCEIKKADEVRKLCDIASEHARAMSSADPRDRERRYELFRSERGRAAALTKSIQNPYARSLALRYLIETCVEADDKEIASQLLRWVTIATVRQEIAETFRMHGWKIDEAG